MPNSEMEAHSVERQPHPGPSDEEVNYTYIELGRALFKALALGQDEAVFKQNALLSHYWTCQGRSKLRPKTEGQGIIMSAF